MGTMAPLCLPPPLLLAMPVHMCIVGKSWPILSQFWWKEQSIIYKLNSENMRKIGQRIRKLWNFEFLQIFTKHFNGTIWILCKLVSWCHYLTILNSFCLENWEKPRFLALKLWLTCVHGYPPLHPGLHSKSNYISKCDSFWCGGLYFEEVISFYSCSRYTFTTMH